VRVNVGISLASQALPPAPKTERPNRNVKEMKNVKAANLVGASRCSTGQAEIITVRNNLGLEMIDSVQNKHDDSQNWIVLDFFSALSGSRLLALTCPGVPWIRG